jgi:hypothetical protein
MQLLPNKQPLTGEYAWIKSVQTPYKLCQGYTSVIHIVAAVAGTRKMVLGNTIYGSLPNRAGVFSFFTDSAGVFELAQQTPGIHYYWERERTKRSQLEVYYEMPTTSEKPRATLEEPWHAWDNPTIANKIIGICEDLVYTNDPIVEVCVRNGMSHFGFDSLFKQRWPYEYYRFKKYKAIPTQDQLARTYAERFCFVPCTN